MIPIAPKAVRNILCLGCHADDIEIGCGGTVLKLLSEHPTAKVTWVVLSADGVRRDEARRSAEVFLGQATHEISIESFRDRYFPCQAEQVKDFVHQLAGKFDADSQPDVVFSHRREDMHQDHRLVAELTWNAFRNHLIFEYEIPKYEGDLGRPNVLVPLSLETCQRKVDTIYDSFASQQDKPWFTKDAFWALLRLRGLECHSPTGYAEGLHCRKMVM
jgi:LmbE family N-acetylglucosaminyl deacetylase